MESSFLTPKITVKFERVHLLRAGAPNAGDVAS